MNQTHILLAIQRSRKSWIYYQSLYFIPLPIHHVGQGSPLILQRNHCITGVPPKWGPYKISIRVHAPTMKLNYIGQLFGGTWHESPANEITNLTTYAKIHHKSLALPMNTSMPCEVKSLYIYIYNIKPYQI